MYVVDGVLSVMVTVLFVYLYVSGIGVGDIVDSLHFSVVKLVDICVGVLLGVLEVLFLSFNDLSVLLGIIGHSGNLVVVLDCSGISNICLIDAVLVVGVVIVVSV